VKTASEMTYTVSGGALNSTQSNPIPPHFLAESHKRQLNQGSFISAVCLVVCFLLLIIFWLYLQSFRRSSHWKCWKVFLGRPLQKSEVNFGNVSNQFRMKFGRVVLPLNWHSNMLSFYAEKCRHLVIAHTASSDSAASNSICSSLYNSKLFSII